MSFDLQTWFVFIAVPFGIVMIGAGTCWNVDHGARERAPTASSPVVRWSSVTLAFAWWLAAAVTVFASAAPAWWAVEGWPKSVWPMLAGVALTAVQWNTSRGDFPLRWVVFGWIAVAAAFLAMPLGESWADMQSLHRPWMAAITLAITCNAFALHLMAQRGTQRWLPLVILASLACPAIIGAASYSALLQACLGAIIATSAIAIVALTGRLPTSPAIMFPSVLFMAPMVAAGRFYSYAEVPPFAYGIALFAPTLIALADRLVVDRATSVRVATSASAAILIVGITTYQFLLS